MVALFMGWLGGWDIKDGGLFGVSARKLLKGFSEMVFRGEISGIWREW